MPARSACIRDGALARLPPRPFGQPVSTPGKLCIQTGRGFCYRCPADEISEEGVRLPRNENTPFSGALHGNAPLLALCRRWQAGLVKCAPRCCEARGPREMHDCQAGLGNTPYCGNVRGRSEQAHRGARGGSRLGTRRQLCGHGLNRPPRLMARGRPRRQPHGRAAPRPVRRQLRPRRGERRYARQQHLLHVLAIASARHQHPLREPAARPVDAAPPYSYLLSSLRQSARCPCGDAEPVLRDGVCERHPANGCRVGAG